MLGGQQLRVRLVVAGAWLAVAVMLAGPQAGRARPVPHAEPMSAYLPRGPLHPAGRWIEDSAGRVIIVHGLELARKTSPYFPPDQSFTAQDARNIADWGFDAVRLGWFWKGLEPQRGQFDWAYLAQLVRDGHLLAGHHIFTLLEAHQDGYNEKLGGAGFPDWATITDSTWAPAESLPGLGVFDLQAARAFDHLYANTDGVADAFANAWAVVAAAFRANPMMLGYDLFNEPNPGSQWESCANPVGCPAFDRETLEPLENKLAAAVRSVDPRTIAFYEPNIYFDSGVSSWLGPPPSASGPTGFAFHDYCLTASATGQPDHESQASGYPACQPIDTNLFANARRAAAMMGAPPLFDEFGDTQDLSQIEGVIRLADQNLTGWIYWSYKDWVDDPGGLGSGPLFDDSDDNGTLRHAKLALLSQPYPVATAGIPIAERFDPADGVFTYSYHADRRISEPTVIFTAPLHYPHGYTVTVSGAQTVSSPDARYLLLRPTGHRDTVRLRLAPVPGAGTAPVTRTATGCRDSCPPGPSTAMAASTMQSQPLGTASGSCDENADDPTVVDSPTLTTASRDVIVELDASGAAGELTNQDGISVAYNGGDTAWLDLGPTPPDGRAATIICRSGATDYSLDFFAIPTLPTSFSGASTHDVNVNLANSRVAFRVPAAGHYVADVAVTQGAIEIGLRRGDGTTPPASIFNAQATDDLGTLRPGIASLDVVALPGPQAHWTVSIHRA